MVRMIDCLAIAAATSWRSKGRRMAVISVRALSDGTFGDRTVVRSICDGSVLRWCLAATHARGAVVRSKLS